MQPMVQWFSNQAGGQFVVIFHFNILDRRMSHTAAAAPYIVRHRWWLVALGVFFFFCFSFVASALRPCDCGRTENTPQHSPAKNAAKRDGVPAALEWKFGFR